MALDLNLFSISNEANFVLEKAKSNIQYATDFDKILDSATLKLHLEMIRKNPDGTSEKNLNELLEDSIKILNLYPDKVIENYKFFSFTRGYETLDYLLKHYLLEKDGIKTSEIFYKGIDLSKESDFTRFQYIDEKEVKIISDLLEPIVFKELTEYYDYHKMVTTVYKLTMPDELYP